MTDPGLPPVTAGAQPPPVAAELRVACVPSSSWYVRRLLQRDLRSVGAAPTAMGDVLLVASELVANAVLHGVAVDGGFDVTWTIRPAEALLAVADAGEELPAPAHPSAAEAGGRGLSIIDSLSVDWGVTPLGVGKVVWGRVPLAEEPDAGGAGGGGRHHLPETMQLS